MKILIVENSKFFLESMLDPMRSIMENAEIEGTENTFCMFQEAGGFDVIITDFSLSTFHLDGGQITQEVKKLANPPIVIGMSSAPERENDFNAAGADGFWNKKGSTSNLISLISRLLKQHK